jgi:hypothetical protein
VSLSLHRYYSFQYECAYIGAKSRQQYSLISEADIQVNRAKKHRNDGLDSAKHTNGEGTLPCSEGKRNLEAQLPFSNQCGAGLCNMGSGWSRLTARQDPLLATSGVQDISGLYNDRS